MEAIMATKRKAKDNEVVKQIDEIRALHGLGSESLQSSLRISGQVEAWDCTLARLALARRFAARYSEEQLDELCDLILKYRPIFGTSHVEILVAIPWPRREKYQRRCIKRNWSRKQLIAAKTRRFKRKSRGGRYPQVSLADAAVELELHANAFCRLVDFLSQPQHGEASILEGLSTRLRTWVELAHDPMKGVRKAARADLKKTQEE
jgi:hypothetical protein